MSESRLGNSRKAAPWSWRIRSISLPSKNFVVGIFTRLRTTIQSTVSPRVSTVSEMSSMSETSSMGKIITATRACALRGEFGKLYHLEGFQDCPVHVCAGINDRHVRLSDATQDTNDFALGLPAGFEERHFIRVGRAEGTIKPIEIVALPFDLSLAHPFASGNGFGRFSDVAPRLNRDNEAMFDFRCRGCRAFFHAFWGSLIVRRNRAPGDSSPKKARVAVSPPAARKSCGSWNGL